MTFKDKLSTVVFGTLIVLSLLLTGCESQQEADAKTRASFDHPELVRADTPKGKLWRAEVSIPNSQSHWVYWFDNSSNTITVNHFVSSGKSHRIQTIVIDGVEYVPKEVKDEK